MNEHLATSEPVTIAQALRWASQRLATGGSSTPRLDAEVLLRSVLGLDRTALFLRLNEPVAPEDLARFVALVERRLAGEPIAYITGEREFMGLPFAVGPGVLVPRPETELLVEWALQWLTCRAGATVIDVGTGSGAIALSLAYHLPKPLTWRIAGSDISRAALCFARHNRSRLGLEREVHLVCGDLVTWCRGPVDLILANLPYLRPHQVANNPELAAEPRLALEAGPDGLDLYRRLVADLPRVLAPGGAVAIEIDPAQAETAPLLLTAGLPDARIAVFPDLAGLPRHVIAERPAALGYDAREG
jgi:release factor glutamine methyltransferase